VWPRNREHLAHVPSQHFAKSGGVARQRAPLVPKERQRLAQRIVPISQADDPQRVPVGPQG
jgi:hypothetical protein